MRRLPRAEDEVVMFIAVDGQALRVEGTVKRVHLHAAAGLNMLTGQMVRDYIRTRGEITVDLHSLRAVEYDEPELDTVVITQTDGTPVYEITTIAPHEDDEA